MKRKLYNEEINFVTLTVVDWIDVFTRRVYCDFIVDCLTHCQRVKGLEVAAYVIMTNHIHMVARSERLLLTDILRDLKTFTSKVLFKMIADNPKESKKKWMLKMFIEHGKQNELNRNHQFWQNGNYPTALWSEKVIQQKIDYIHMNPVKAGYVDAPEKYWYSSANPFSPVEVTSFDDVSSVDA